MKNSATFEKTGTDFRSLLVKEKCLSPVNNICSCLPDNFQDNIIKYSENQEKICLECIWHRKKH